MASPAPLSPPPSWLAPSTPRQAEAITHQVSALAEALASGSIPNARFKEATDTLNRALARAWEMAGAPLRQPYGEGGRCPYPEGVDDMFYTHPTLATFARVAKKVAALPPHALTTAWARVIEEATPVAEAWARVKPLAVKRQVRTEAERVAAQFTPPPVTSQAQVRVQGLLEESVNASYETLCDLLRKDRRTLLDGFLDTARRAENDPTLRNRYRETYDVYWHFDRRNTASPARGDRHGFSELSAWVSQDPDTGTWKEVPGVEALIDAAARKHADDLRRLFVVKNLRKIASILEAKGDERFDDAEVMGTPVNISRLEGALRFSFKDGSSFRVNNGIVFSRSSLGTPFERFPLTFHAVVLPSGEPMPQPSEERMNTVFAQTNGPVPEPVARRRVRP